MKLTKVGCMAILVFMIGTYMVVSNPDITNKLFIFIFRSFMMGGMMVFSMFGIEKEE